MASTRSLLNTARLMDENRTLFKLKEMEYLEKICDKVGNISLTGGKGVLDAAGRAGRGAGLTVYRIMVYRNGMPVN